MAKATRPKIFQLDVLEQVDALSKLNIYELSDIIYQGNLQLKKETDIKKIEKIQETIVATHVEIENRIKKIRR